MGTTDRQRHDGSVLDRIISLTDSQLVEGKWEKRDIEKHVRDDQRHVFIASERDGEIECTEVASMSSARRPRTVLGYVLTGVHSLAEIDAHLPIPAERHFDREQFPIGMVTSIVVRGDRQGEGIGSRLGAVAMTETFFENPDVDLAFTVAWIREDQESNLALARYYGEPIAEYEEYYGDARDCPECPEDDYCSCTYRIYQTAV
jgi:ribosomal protein S18 acetylase RimI-like enzyme